MRAPLLVAVAYLLMAFGLEFGALPLLGESWGLVQWGDLRLLALGVVLAGCVRQRWEAVIFALASAILTGSISGPGHLGCAIFSFVLAAYLASGLTRWFVLEYVSVRLPVFFVMILGEDWISAALRHAFWPQTLVEIPWIAHLATALLGTILYVPLSHWFKFRPPPAVPIGRKKR